MKAAAQVCAPEAEASCAVTRVTHGVINGCFWLCSSSPCYLNALAKAPWIALLLLGVCWRFFMSTLLLYHLP